MVRRAKIAFLDRDGVVNESVVINGKPYAPKTFDQFKILPKVAESLINLKNAGYIIAIVTNQPDVSLGRQTLNNLNAMHNYLLSNYAIDVIKVCVHSDNDFCHCRKPKPGMLLEIAEEYGVAPEICIMVGDRWRDIEAGQRAGCKANYFIDYNYNEKRPSGSFELVSSLYDCTLKIINQI